MKKLTGTCYIQDKKLKEKIQECIKQFYSIELLDSFKDRIEVIEKLGQKNPDIFFIEVDDADQSIELLSQIANPPFIIGVASKREMSQTLLDSGFYDILYAGELKLDYFCKKMSKIFRLVNSLTLKNVMNSASESNSTYINRKISIPRRKFIFVRSKKTSVKVFFDEILYIKNAGSDSKLFLSNNKTLYHGSSLKKFLLQLPSEYFVRINNSSIINIDKIDRIDKNKIVIQKEEMKVSKVYYGDIRKLLVESNF